MTQNKHINAKNEDFLQIFSQKQQVQRRLKCASCHIQFARFQKYHYPLLF